MSSFSQPFRDIFITTVSDGPAFIDKLFQKKFGAPAPHYGHSVIAFYRQSWQHFVPVCYANFLPHDEILLGGGAMTDTMAFRAMPRDLFHEIKQSGGVYVPLLRFAIDHLGPQCDAIFGFAGDKLAHEQDIKAGFEPTAYPNLLVHFHKPLSEERKTALIEKANAVGPF